MRVREAATPLVMTLRLGNVRCEQDRRLGPGRPQWPAVDVARFEEVADRRGRRGIPAKRRGILAAVPIARPEGGRTFAPLCGGQSLLRLSESSLSVRARRVKPTKAAAIVANHLSCGS